MKWDGTNRCVQCKQIFHGRNAYTCLCETCSDNAARANQAWREGGDEWSTDAENDE